MNTTDWNYRNCLQILSEELVPATGCTEPIAIAYAAAIARETLGCLPEKVDVHCSGNIIKNVKSVVVPCTGHLRGIPAAAAAGIVAGDPAEKLDLLQNVSPAEREQLSRYLAQTPFTVGMLNSNFVFDLLVTVWGQGQSAQVRIAGHHTNVVLIRKNDQNVFEKDVEESGSSCAGDRGALTVASILDFADSVEIADVRPLLSRQVAYNTAISQEGLAGDYGANIGRVLLRRGDTLRTRIMAAAAAGSDARMNGCEMPVVINSGSGNQGIAVCVPIVVFAREKGIGEDRMYRALALANLLAVHQRYGIGRLSAYCGAINAGIASVCGIAYLQGESLAGISDILISGLAIASGVVCDGAKSSCASKIVIGIEAGLMGYDMHGGHQRFLDGEGIVKRDAEATIDAVARLGRDGMRETDREILRIMTEN